MTYGSIHVEFLSAAVHDYGHNNGVVHLLEEREEDRCEKKVETYLQYYTCCFIDTAFRLRRYCLVCEQAHGRSLTAKLRRNDSIAQDAVARTIPREKAAPEYLD